MPSAAELEWINEVEKLGFNQMTKMMETNSLHRFCYGQYQWCGNYSLNITFYLYAYLEFSNLYVRFALDQIQSVY